MVLLRLAVLLLVFALTPLPTAAHATGPAPTDAGKQSVLWPYFHLPPFFVDEGGALAGGRGARILALLRRGMPELDHEALPAPPKRMLQLAREKRRVVLSGLLKTPERMQYLAYTSLPCRMVFDLRIVLRAQDAGHAPFVAPVSMRALLKDDAITAAMAPDLYLGKLQDILERHRDAPNMETVAGTDPLRHMLEMLDSGRVDWFLFAPTIAASRAQRLGLSGSVAMLRVAEASPGPALGYFACPNTAWGRAMVRRIDGLLTEAILSGRLRGILADGLPEGLQDLFDQNFRTHFLAPARTLRATLPNRRPLLPRAKGAPGIDE